MPNRNPYPKVYVKTASEKAKLSLLSMFNLVLTNIELHTHTLPPSHNCLIQIQTINLEKNTHKQTHWTQLLLSPNSNLMISLTLSTTHGAVEWK